MNWFKRLEKKIRRRLMHDPEWNEKLERLRQRVQLLGSDDPLFPLLGDLLNEFATVELEAGCKPQIGDEEAHRCRGRLGMCVELQQELEKLWRESRRPVERKPET